LPVSSDHYQRRRIIHDRGAIRRARGEVVLQPERVTNFMCSQLTQSREHHLLHDFLSHGFVFAVGSEQA
jgi:hypothetical protein